MSSLANRHRRPSTADQTLDEREELARRRIAQGIAEAQRLGTTVTVETARLIAATLHPGSGSHLEQFAATGTMLLPELLAELTEVERAEARWTEALRQYLKATIGTDPDWEVVI